MRQGSGIKGDSKLGVAHVQSAYFRYNGLYTAHIHDRANNEDYSSADSLDLLTLSVLCPEEQGNCIYQARALYEHIYSVVPLYPGCDDGTGARQSLSTNIINNDIDNPNSFQIIPNPNDGNFNIKSDKNLSVALLLVYDYTGRLLKKTTIHFESNTAKLHFDLSSGVYQLLITENEGICTSFKIIVNK